MVKMFRACEMDQDWPLPSSLHEFALPGHMARFVRDTVHEALGLSAMLVSYAKARGHPCLPSEVLPVR